jgi:hypothetical protein
VDLTLGAVQVVGAQPVIIALITAGFAAIAAIGVALINKHDLMAKDIKTTKEQVQNSHSTNLRDDLDGLHADVRLVLRAIEGLRDEVHDERRERIKADEALAKRIAA